MSQTWTRGRRPLPPYGKALLEDVRQGRPINCFVYAGARCFDLAQRRVQALAIPDDAEWRAMDWSLIAGLAITLISRGWGEERTAELARHLVRAGAELVVALTVTRDGEMPSIEYRAFRPRRAAAAA